MADESVTPSEAPKAPSEPPVAPKVDATAASPPQYVVLMETNGDECESWYYFIKRDGNEAALGHLQAQLSQIEMYITEDMSTFDLDLDHAVSDSTAREMTSLELNSVTFHRKFDGKLKPVNLRLKRKDSNERRLQKLNQALGHQKIEEFIDGEDIHPNNVLEDGAEEESDHEGDEEVVAPMPL